MPTDEYHRPSDTPIVRYHVRLSPLRTAATTFTLGMLATVVACGAAATMDQAVQGKWNCVATDPGEDAKAATVVVGDGTFQYTAGYRTGSGTWTRSGNTITVTADGEKGELQLLNIPVNTDRSFTFTMQPSSGEPTDHSATFDGHTLRFTIKNTQIACARQ